VSLVGYGFWSGVRIALFVATLIGCVLLSTANAQMHGYVEPCAVVFVQDSTTTCEECLFDHANPKSCAESLGSRGFTLQCHTGGHSVPAQVWCKPREGVSELPRVAVLGLVVGGVLLLTAGFLWWKRRERAAS